MHFSSPRISLYFRVAFFRVTQLKLKRVSILSIHWYTKRTVFSPRINWLLFRLWACNSFPFRLHQDFFSSSSKTHYVRICHILWPTLASRTYFPLVLSVEPQKIGQQHFFFQFTCVLRYILNIDLLKSFQVCVPSSGVNENLTFSRLLGQASSIKYTPGQDQWKKNWLIGRWVNPEVPSVKTYLIAEISSHFRKRLMVHTHPAEIFHSTNFV